MTENPFKPHTPIEKTDPDANRKVVETLLGTDVADEYDGLKNPDSSYRKDDRKDLSLTDEEKEHLFGRESLRHWTREDCIEWAKSIGEDAAWLHRTFNFNKDGTIDAVGDLTFASNEKLKKLPPNLVIVHGELSLTDCYNLEVLPERLGVLKDAYITYAYKLHHVPDRFIVSGSLYLWGCDAIVALGDGLTVNGNLNIPRHLREEAEELKRKGLIEGFIQAV